MQAAATLAAYKLQVFLTEAEATLVRTGSNHKLPVTLKLVYLLLTQTKITADVHTTIKCTFLIKQQLQVRVSQSIATLFSQQAAVLNAQYYEKKENVQ